jgi:unspecific monooxygenase
MIRNSLDWPMTYFTGVLGGNALPDPDATARWQTWLTRMITDSHKAHPTKTSSNASLYDYFYDSFKAVDPDMGFNEMASLIAVECDDHVSASHFGLGMLLAYAMYELSRYPYWQQ